LSTLRLCLLLLLWRLLSALRLRLLLLLWRLLSTLRLCLLLLLWRLLSALRLRLLLRLLMLLGLLSVLRLAFLLLIAIALSVYQRAEPQDKPGGTGHSYDLHGSSSTPAPRPGFSLGDPASLNQLDGQHHERDHEQYMNQSAHRVGSHQT
jgi:hypothetical protein